MRRRWARSTTASLLSVWILADEYGSSPTFVNRFCCLHGGRRECSRDRSTEQVDIEIAQRSAPRVRHVDEMHRLTYGSLELAPR
jgi:hypothetical protein